MNALPNLPQFEYDSADTTNVGVECQKLVLRFENVLVAYDINTDASKKLYYYILLVLLCMIFTKHCPLLQLVTITPIHS